jgi:hypothetical protein
MCGVVVDIELLAENTKSRFICGDALGIFPFVGVDWSPVTVPEMYAILLGELCFAVELRP